MPFIWKISVAGGVPVTLESLGISGAVLQRRSLDKGTLSFILKVSDITAAIPFAYATEVTLYLNDVLYYTGRVRPAPAANFNRQESSWLINVEDAWWELERTVYRQPAVVKKADFTGLRGYLTSRIAFAQDAWGRSITQAEQMADALSHANGQNPNRITTGTLANLTARWNREETREITVLEVLRRAANLAPSAHAKSTYTPAGNLEIAFAARADLPLVTLDLADADLIADVSLLRSRDDLVPPGVVFDFEGTVLDDDQVEQKQLTRQSAGTPGAAGTIYSTIKLGPCDTVPAGAATAYYNALSTVMWEGTITLKERECSGLVAPGNRIRLLNGVAAWATMDAVVQEVIENIQTGETIIQLAPAEVLGLDDFLGQLSRFRNRPAPTGACDTMHNGTEGVDEGIDDEGNIVGTGRMVIGNAPGVGSPESNPRAGRSGVAYLGTAGGLTGSTNLTLCDGTTVSVLTRS